MIVTKTPLRISFAGGGTDLAAFYSHEPGAVLSATINRYIYISIHQGFSERIILKYSKTEDVGSIDEVEHPLIRECLREAGYKGAIELASFADIPSTGSGLGSSSAFAVGFLNGLYALNHRGAPGPKQYCAEAACRVEIQRLQEPIGKQDQFASAFGGINLFRFNPDESVDVHPVVLTEEQLAFLEARLLLFFTGQTRQTRDILKEQERITVSSIEKRRILSQMRDQALQLHAEFNAGNLESLGILLHEAWELKRSLTRSISNVEIDEWYARARNAGAVGGKLLGAGGGGFLLFYVEPEHCNRVIRALSELRCLPVKFSLAGTQIEYVSSSP